MTVTDKVTFDANVLVYAIDGFDPVRQASAKSIFEIGVRTRCPLGLQVIGEFYRAATRKLRLSPEFALQRVREALTAFHTFPHTPGAFALGAVEATAGHFSFWDGVLLASAEEAGCTVMLSEDMHDGAKLGNITVRNPFGVKGLSDAAKEALGV